MSDAFHALLIEHLPRLRSYALNLTRSAATADDLVQETALKALRAESQFTPGTNFAAWTYRILRNNHINNLRNAQHIILDIDGIAEDQFAQDSTQENHVMATETLNAVASLSRRDASILMAIAQDGTTYQEAARGLRCKLGTFKSRLSRARSRLHTALSPA